MRRLWAAALLMNASQAMDNDERAEMQLARDRYGNRASNLRARDRMNSGTEWLPDMTDAQCLESYRGGSGLDDAAAVSHLIRMRPPKLDHPDWATYHLFRREHDGKQRKPTPWNSKAPSVEVRTPHAAAEEEGLELLPDQERIPAGHSRYVGVLKCCDGHDRWIADFPITREEVETRFWAGLSKDEYGLRQINLGVYSPQIEAARARRDFLAGHWDGWLHWGAEMDRCSRRPGCACFACEAQVRAYRKGIELHRPTEPCVADQPDGLCIQQYSTSTLQDNAYRQHYGTA